MALAALGDPARFRALFARAIPLTPDRVRARPRPVPAAGAPARLAPRHPGVHRRHLPARAPGEEVTQVHADLAAALQERTEQVMVHLARRARAVTGARRLCVGGGVAMNCVGIGKILADGQFDEVYVPPAPGDSGTAIGAALAAHRDVTGAVPGGLVRSCYLGPAYPDFTPAAEPGPGLTARQVADPARFLAAQLAAGKIAGLFQGRLEAGPRALGNRSILASPLIPDVTARLNAAVKFREPFRPFAPVVLAEHARPTTSGWPSPARSCRSPCPSPTWPGTRSRRRARQRHRPRADPRPRSRTRSWPTCSAGSPTLTGVPVLINTSLNVKGKPICGTPQMAIDCLASSGLDGLMLDGGWWVGK